MRKRKCWICGDRECQYFGTLLEDMVREGEIKRKRKNLYYLGNIDLFKRCLEISEKKVKGLSKIVAYASALYVMGTCYPRKPEEKEIQHKAAIVYLIASKIVRLKKKKRGEEHE